MIKSFLGKLKSDKSGNYEKIKNERQTYDMPIIFGEDLYKNVNLYFNSDDIKLSLTTHITYYIFKYNNIIFKKPSEQFPIIIYDLNCKCPAVKLIPFKNEKCQIEYDETGLSVYCNVRKQINIKHEGACRISKKQSIYFKPCGWHFKSDNKIENFKYVAILLDSDLPTPFNEFKKCVKQSGDQVVY